MDISLTDNEVRVLGCLMEKEMATPDYYPLSLNALTNACNQKSNRNPVVSYDEDTVVDALNGLREYQLVRQSNMGRVTKHEQVFSKELKLVAREQAILCILLLRGPQTAGEIRNRTERLYAFSNLDEVQETITSLENMALVVKLLRQPGRKESRYAHLLSRESQEMPVEAGPQAEAATMVDHQENDRVSGLQEQIDELRQEIQRLQREFMTFKSQFD
jgi:uncharacterized protein YceH (UPF0502 family)